MKFAQKEFRAGYILPLVLGIILAISVLFGSLLLLPGALGRYGRAVYEEARAIYEAESAILADLNQFPSGYFGGLPLVKRLVAGPWERRCAQLPQEGSLVVPLVCVVIGSSYGEKSFRDWQQPAERYKAELRQRLLEETADFQVSGNKRIFGALEQRALHVRDGDLLLDSEDSIPVANFYVEGNVLLRGNAVFDTLRVYASGQIQVEENVHIGFGELASEDQVEFSGKSIFRGVVVAAKHFRVADKAKARFPSFAISFGLGLQGVELLDKASFEGVVGAPAGKVNVEETQVQGAYFTGAATDSAMAVLPRFFEGMPIVLAREVLREK